MRRISAAIAIAVPLCLAAGCASKGRVEVVNADNVIAAANKGDTVRITTIDGFKKKFVITKITNKALYGEGERVLYTDMRKVELEETGGIFHDITQGIKNIF